jgi:hypothetical protein
VHAAEAVRVVRNGGHVRVALVRVAEGRKAERAKVAAAAGPRARLAGVGGWVGGGHGRGGRAGQKSVRLGAHSQARRTRHSPQTRWRSGGT